MPTFGISPAAGKKFQIIFLFFYYWKRGNNSSFFYCHNLDELRLNILIDLDEALAYNIGVRRNYTMDAKERKKKAEFHHQLIKLLTVEEDDEAFYKRLLWGLEIITNELIRFK